MNKLHSLCLVIMLCLIVPSCGYDPYDFLLKKAGDEYWQQYAWQYQGHHFKIIVHFPIAVYQFYKSFPKNMLYPEYANEYDGHRYLADVSQKLMNLAEPYHFSKREIAQYLLAFTQSVPYRRDPPGPGDYPKYAIETLLEQGDCEDLSILYISLLNASHLHFYCALIEIPSESHMAAGVEIEESEYFYRGQSGHNYTFAECTNKNWKLGQVSYPNDSVRIFEIPPANPVRYAKLKKRSTPLSHMINQES